MPSAPLPYNEAQRLDALRACRILDSAPERSFDGLVELAARLTQAPMAVLSLVDHTRQWFKARVGLDVHETPRAHSFCAHAILQPTPLIVEDAARDARFADNPLVMGPPGIRFYAGYPLELSDGVRLGTLCVIETRPRTLSSSEQSALASLADQAAAQLELRRALEGLRTQRERERQEADQSLAARARESFRIGQVLQKQISVSLWRMAKTLKDCVPKVPAQEETLRRTLLSVSDEVAETAIDCRALATRIRAFALLKLGWLPTVRADIEQLQCEFNVRIMLKDDEDPDRLLGYAAAQRLSEFVHAALSTAIELWGAWSLKVTLAKRGSLLHVAILHDGSREGGMVVALHPSSRLHVLAAELGSELSEAPVGHLHELRLSVAVPSPP
jgi:hypothetical protein